jgi:glycogen phosphorylase
LSTESDIPQIFKYLMDRYASLPPRPPRISRINELAVDLWWSWNEARAVFRRLDYSVWRWTDHNPVRMLWTLPQERLEKAASDPEFVALYDRAVEALDAARAARNTWWTKTVAAPHDGRAIAYFSAEFALHQSLPIYAGGLGVLAGDH